MSLYFFYDEINGPIIKYPTLKPYLLTYQTPMAGDLLLFRMKKQEIKRDDCFELKILVNEKNKHKIQTLSLLYIYIYSFAIYFNMLLQLYQLISVQHHFLILKHIQCHFSTLTLYLFDFFSTLKICAQNQHYLLVIKTKHFILWQPYRNFFPPPP